MPQLTTKRLLLVPFSYELIQAAIRSRAELERLLKAGVHEEWPNPDFREILPFLAEETAKDPELAHWTFLIVHSNDRTVIGDIGFKGKPGSDEVVEIGYGIIPAYRGQGFATEAADGLVTWALSHQAVKRVIAECLCSNTASIHVLEKIGMCRTGVEGDMLKWEKVFKPPI